MSSAHDVLGSLMSVTAECNRPADPGIDGCGAIPYAGVCATSDWLDEP